MKSPHVAVLAVVGWYLMVPPPRSSGSNDFEAYPPLWEWSVYSAYDLAGQCEKAKSLNRESHKGIDDPMHLNFERAQCIASSDPRLNDPRRKP